MKAELDASNYAIKGDLKNETHIAKSKFAKKLIYQAQNLKLINQVLIN